MSFKPPNQLQYSIHTYIYIIYNIVFRGCSLLHLNLLLCLAHLQFRQYIHIVAVHLIHSLECVGCHRHGQIKQYRAFLSTQVLLLYNQHSTVQKSSFLLLKLRIFRFMHSKSSWSSILCKKVKICFKLKIIACSTQSISITRC